MSSGEEEVCPKCATYHSLKTHWEIKSTSVKYCGNGSCLEEEHVTKAKYVVLATGSHDDPRKLMVGVKYESSSKIIINLQWRLIYSTCFCTALF